MKRSLLTAVLMVFCYCFSPSANAQPGVLDQTFGVGGKVVTNLIFAGIGRSVVVQSNGKIIADATDYQYGSSVLARYNNDGSIDSAFNYYSGFGNSNPYFFQEIVLQSDQKVLVNGYAFISTDTVSVFVIRINANGKPDSSFGVNGYVYLPRIGISSVHGSNMVVKQNGKIIVGFTLLQNSSSRCDDFVLYQLMPNGSLDSSFGSHGSVFFKNFACEGKEEYKNVDIAISYNDQILIAANRYDSLTNKFFNGIFRFNPSGGFDSTYGINGYAPVDFRIKDIVLDSHDNLLVGGTTSDSLSHMGIGLLSLDSMGLLNTNFGFGGKVVTTLSRDSLFASASSLTIQPNGKILVAGTLYNTNTPLDFLLIRYNSNGTIDDFFGKKGIIYTDFESDDEECFASLIQPDGKIIVVGGGFNRNFNWVFSMARYENNARIYYNSLIASTFLDKNSNGIKDANESLFSKGNLISLNAGIDTIRSIFYADKISVDLDTGTYVTRFIPYSPAYNVVPSSHVTSNSTYFHDDSVSFAVQPIPGQRDVAVNLVSLNAARPNFYLGYQLVYSNQGTDTVTNGVIKLVKSNKLTFSNASVAPNSIVGDTLIWNFTDLKPLQDSSIFLDFYVKAPPLVNLGDTLQSTVTITTNKPDLTPADNTSAVKQVVRAAYDPNDKTENHGGKITTLQMANGDYLQYTIRFQNTGNDTAFNVYIRDTLDNKLDWSTMQILTASHSYQMTMNDGNKCLFTLRNINLVDSTTNEPSSHGYIVYKVKPKLSVALGDIIKNTAAIYFDYNLPIFTNTETTTIVSEILPLRLLSFIAKKENKTNLLNWTTTNEISVDHFEIERSINGREFSKIGIVSSELSVGSLHKYSYSDNNPFASPLSNPVGEGPGVRFYRLKMMDKDGKFEYSPIRMINNNADDQISIYPNPARDMVTVTHPSTNSIAQLLLTDITGRILRRTTVTSEAVQTNMNIKGLPAGKYNLTWSNGLINHTQALVID